MNRSQQRCRLIWTFSLLCISLVACSLAARGQESETKLVVAVTDSNGAPISGASIVIDQVGCECAPCPSDIKNCQSQCCETRTSKPYCCIVAFKRASDEKGEATFNVRPGIYKAKVEVQGFKSINLEGIQVSGGRTNRVEAKMDVGADLAAPVVETSKAATQSDAKVFTLNFGDRGANAIVTVKKAGCSCGECPQGKRCPSGCCECKQGNCVCCIVAEGTANKKGSRSFLLAPGEYDVIFKVADELSGSFSGITIDTKDKEVKLSVTLNARPQK